MGERQSLWYRRSSTQHRVGVPVVAEQGVRQKFDEIQFTLIEPRGSDLIVRRRVRWWMTP
jgi:hypothetical protein